MGDALVEIGKALLEPYAKDMWDQLNGNEYGDAEKSTQAILTAIQDAKNSIIQELSAVILSTELGQQTTHIETWAQKLAECFLAKQENAKNADDRLKTLKHQLDDSTDGILYVLNRIDSILRQTSSIGNVGLIKICCQRLDKDLANPKQIDKDMGWYILEMNKFLAAAVRWQTAGLALRLFTAQGDQNECNRYMGAWRANIDKQLEYTRDCYHPMIRSFKFSFWDKIPDDRLWRLKIPKSTSWFNIRVSHKRYSPYESLRQKWDLWLGKPSPSGVVGFKDYDPNKPDPAIQFKLSPPPDQPNRERTSGQWSILQNADSPGASLWGLFYVNLNTDTPTVDQYRWHLVRYPEEGWSQMRFKLCPVDTENRAFTMVVQDSRFQRKHALDNYLWDYVFEADHVEGTGWP